MQDGNGQLEPVECVTVKMKILNRLFIKTVGQTPRTRTSCAHILSSSPVITRNLNRHNAQYSTTKATTTTGCHHFRLECLLILLYIVLRP